jgi:hypothetical protein
MAAEELYVENSGSSSAGMNDSPALHLKTYIFLGFVILFAPLGNILLGKGMKNIGSAKHWSLGEALPILGSILSSPYIWMGIGCLLAMFVAYMVLLTWADYSYVQPASSFSYAVTGVLSYFILGEIISPLRCLGIAVICVGVLVVGHTAPRTTGHA